MANEFLKNETVRHWLLSGGVFCVLIGVVAAQRYLDRIQPPYLPPPTLNADKSNAPGVLQRAARGAAVAGAINRANDAVRTSNRVALRDALNDLRQLKAASRVAPLMLAVAEDLVSEAGVLDVRAQELKGEEARAMQAQAAQRYREALQLDPRFSSSDPYLVNALGYFLAERGSTPADFREAERLTRRSLQIWDERVKNARADSSDDSETPAASDVFSRANTRDSLAWALYRQGRHEEALREQQQAVIEATVSARALPIPQPVPAELYFHLGEIYRALKRPAEAREQYETALELKPEDAATLQALKQLANGSNTPKKPDSKNSTQNSGTKNGRAKGGAASPKSRLPVKPAPRMPRKSEPDDSEPDDSDPGELEPEVPVVPATNPLIA